MTKETLGKAGKLKEAKSLLKSFLEKNYHQSSAQVLDNQSLREAYCLDSIGCMKIAQLLETTFGIRFEAKEVCESTFESLSSILALLERKFSEKG